MKSSPKILFVLLNICSLMANAQDTVSMPVCASDFVVIAHRGSHLIKPENTIAAIKDAIRLGADYVEIDVRTTRDNKLILNHNESVDLGAGQKSLVKDLTLSELLRLELKGKDGKIYHLAEFRDALRACEGKINIYLDFKAADVSDVYAQILDAGMKENILVYLNGFEQYAEWKKVAPQMPLMSSLPSDVKTGPEAGAFLEKIKLQAVDNAKTPDLISAMKLMNVYVLLDGQAKTEDPETWKPFLEKKIQGLQTDHPEALISYLKSIGLRR